ncbi:MAG: prolyl oligopeptidase family serine peptidase [Gammaproteobacteria bacterium]
MSASNTSSTLYGNWLSPISSELIVSDSVSIDEPLLTADAIYYIERRPQESGRCVIVKVCNNKATDILPAPFSARSRVHEYGGGCYCITGQQVFFINDSDQDIYCIKNNQIRRITTSENSRFADFIYDKKHHRLIAVCETHNHDQVTNAIVSINVKTGELFTLEQGHDFYASPRLNARASQLCWQSWNHPNMPWDGNSLWLADINKTGLTENKKHIAGADNVSVFQPQWSPDDILHFISDDSGCWHLYRYNEIRFTENKNNGEITQLTKGDKEFGLPQWVFAQSSYAFIDDSHIICCYQSQGQATLALLSTAEQVTQKTTLRDIPTLWQEFSSIKATNNKLCFVAASSASFPQLILATVSVANSDEKPVSLTSSVIKSSCQLAVAKEYYSFAQSKTFTNRHKQKVYANYYPPTNPDYQNQANSITGKHSDKEAPPLIIICHGGPTGQASTALDPKKQFWTSRGFALLDVNYSGSTGYGRQYRERLNGKWGLLDVQDCCDAALYAVSQGLANKDQLIIRGSSAGGYTVLSALTFEDVFSAGASYYGIAELCSLASDTHKFESRYLDRLIGPYPESKSLYQQRSPINSSAQLNCPVIFFQGLEDRVVPKEQAEQMFEALNEKGLPVAAQYYAGEQHGFRKAETIKQSLENELSFYQLVFNLKPKDQINFIGDIELKNI